jgi:tetratricopeptide (TPR) repeat protein
LLHLDESVLVKPLEDANKLIELYPNNPDSYIMRATVYTAQRELLKSQTDVLKALDLDPESAQANFLAAQVLLQLGKNDEMIPYAEKAAALQPWDSTIHQMLGQAWLNKGDNAKAIASWEKSITIKPDQPDLLFTMAATQWLMGDELGAIKNFEKAMAIKDGLTLDQMDKAEQAVNFLKTVPPAVNGIRTVKDTKFKYTINYAIHWLPLPMTTQQSYFALVLEVGTNNAPTQLRFELSTKDLPTNWGIGAYHIADIVDGELTRALDSYKHISRLSFQAKSIVGVVSKYEYVGATRNGTHENYTGKMYIFFYNGRYALIELMAPSNKFAEMEVLADKVVATFDYTE